MIIAEQKPLEEIRSMAAKHKKILLLGCGTCVTVCMAGGEKEVGILASALRMARKLEGNRIEIIEDTILRQCEWEYLEEIAPKVDEVEAVISMACGVGVQAMAQQFPDKLIYPALNTTSLGMPAQHGLWVENCRGCGNCGLARFGAVCPVARCSKSLLNGPCGGSQDGKCEVNPEADCGWQLIYERMERLDQLELLEDILPAKNWSTDRDNGPRRTVREDVFIADVKGGTE
ncbi:MAG: methylenetetrahydrofolate reductase C-terminal domain-containing protein [bacterium]|nr:methylenetetrahydrofolate reductase C-terminal domain-containing protein [bacterium]